MKLPSWLEKKKKETPEQETDHRVVYPLGPIDRQAERNEKVLRAGWIFLGVVVLAAVVIVLLLLPKREKKPADEKETIPVTAGNAGQESGKTEAPDRERPDYNGQNVRIRSVDCEYTEPTELTVSVQHAADLTALGEAAAENVRAHGWGEVECSSAQDGSLLLTAKDAAVLNAADYDKQEAFLASSQPENMARTFLQDSGIIELLRPYGITLSAEAVNKDGEISFSGNGDDALTECTLRFSFLFTGAFNQAKLRAVVPDGGVTTSEIVPMKKAASTAVSWSSAGAEETSVTAVEIRSIRGLPFYVFLCEDGTAAYALAVKETVLDEIPEAKAVYEELMTSGIQEYIEQPGAA